MAACDWLLAPFAIHSRTPTPLHAAKAQWLPFPSPPMPAHHRAGGSGNVCASVFRGGVLPAQTVLPPAAFPILGLEAASPSSTSLLASASASASAPTSATATGLRPSPFLLFTPSLFFRTNSGCSFFFFPLSFPSSILLPHYLLRTTDLEETERGAPGSRLGYRDKGAPLLNPPIQAIGPGSLPRAVPAPRRLRLD